MPSVRWLEPFFQTRGEHDPGGKGGGGSGGVVTRELLAVFDGGGAPLGAGAQGDASVPFAATILGWVLLADQAGSITVDIWKDVYGSYPPTGADTITGGSPPKITAAIKNSSTVLTGWTTAIAAGDTLRFTIISAGTIGRVTLGLTLKG